MTHAPGKDVRRSRPRLVLFALAALALLLLLLRLAEFVAHTGRHHAVHAAPSTPPAHTTRGVAIASEETLGMARLSAERCEESLSAHPDAVSCG